jgi:hypothetical protein
VHTGAAQACTQAIRAGVQPGTRLPDRRRGHRNGRAGRHLRCTDDADDREDLEALHQGTLPEQAVGKFRRDHEQIQAAQRRVAASSVKIAYGIDCGMFAFSQGINEFRAMTAAGISPVRALKAATSVAAELLGRDDLGVQEAGRCAANRYQLGSTARGEKPTRASNSPTRRIPSSYDSRH